MNTWRSDVQEAGRWESTAEGLRLNFDVRNWSKLSVPINKILFQGGRALAIGKIIEKTHRRNISLISDNIAQLPSVAPSPHATRMCINKQAATVIPRPTLASRYDAGDKLSPYDSGQKIHETSSCLQWMAAT